jgi:hypothetical protein
MTFALRGVALAVAVTLISSSLASQAMSGTYTCASGNPGGAFDYADIGDFFNHLETRGVAGNVVLEVFDVGGSFTSKPSYQLGADPLPPTPPPVLFGTCAS